MLLHTPKYYNPILVRVLMIKKTTQHRGADGKLRFRRRFSKNR